ncbi:MAG: DUF2829 domain-containing protein [Planctomycetes bacterium]|nr:DUF2829 domain-containing protein [Planctomycetota bacterium]
MNFSEALKAMKMGSKVSREAWRGLIAYYEITKEPHTNTTVIKRFIPDGRNIIVSNIDIDDILAEDWWLVT